MAPYTGIPRSMETLAWTEIIITREYIIKLLINWTLSPSIVHSESAAFEVNSILSTMPSHVRLEICIHMGKQSALAETYEVEYALMSISEIGKGIIEIVHIGRQITFQCLQIIIFAFFLILRLALWGLSGSVNGSVSLRPSCNACQSSQKFNLKARELSGFYFRAHMSVVFASLEGLVDFKAP